MIYLEQVVQIEQQTRVRNVLDTQKQTNKTYEELVERQKIQIKVRPQVIERKNWPKYGEVKDIPKGEMKKGDYLKEKAITIETSDNLDKSENDFIQKIQNLNTDDIKQSNQRQKNQNQQISTEKLTKEQEQDEKKRQRDEQWAKSIAENDVSIKIENVALEEGAENESDFKEFVSSIIKQSINDAHSLQDFNNFQIRVLRVKGFDKGLIRAFVSFRDKHHANTAFKALQDDISYNNCVLGISWALPSRARGPTGTTQQTIKKF